MKHKIQTVKTHITNHRAKYAAGATFVVCAAAHIAVVQDMNGFLKDHDLYDTRYNSED